MHRALPQKSNTDLRLPATNRQKLSFPRSSRLWNSLQADWIQCPFLIALKNIMKNEGEGPQMQALSLFPVAARLTLGDWFKNHLFGSLVALGRFVCVWYFGWYYIFTPMLS